MSYENLLYLKILKRSFYVYTTKQVTIGDEKEDTHIALYAALGGRFTIFCFL